jgi:hypothetical protein
VLLLVQECSQRTTGKELSDDAEDRWTAACSNQLQKKNVESVKDFVCHDKTERCSI